MSLNKLSTPDFESYNNDIPIKESKIDNEIISITWKDETKSKFHSIWLRDNCACPLCIDTTTKERIYDLSDIPDSIKPLAISVTCDGALEIIWSHNNHKSIYHPERLRVHCYSNLKSIDKQDSEQKLWNSSFQEHIPIFDTQLFLEDDNVRYEFLRSVQKYGISLLTGVPKSEQDFEKITKKIGLLRDMNWGNIFSIKMDPDVGYIANGTYKITPHNDASTRERIPGIQIFQCVENTTEGGGSYWVDGFFIAKLLAETYPEDYKLLTTVPWEFANRDKNSHYRNKQAIIKVNQQNEPVEINDTYWLREPLMIDFNLINLSSG